MTEAFNILLIDSNPKDCERVQRILAQNTPPIKQLFIANSLEQSKKFIASENITLILLSFNLTDSQGVDTYRQIAAFALGAPIIILSTQNEKEIIFQAIKLGAVHYLIKEQLTLESITQAIQYVFWSNKSIYQGIQQ